MKILDRTGYVLVFIGDIFFALAFQIMSRSEKLKFTKNILESLQDTVEKLENLESKNE